PTRFAVVSWARRWVYEPGQLKSTDWMSIMMMPMFGLVGGLGAAIIIYLFSWKNGTLDSQRLLLTGIAIGSGFGAFSMYL
ncbi:iron chelate uptake ABC transporter family permease subunit, partial [Bacillus cereus group sp. N6]|uniref:iron chelate uptake ABC transporter family permease subunit n=1 Tax=Bacillus cereus group sp. N6 TaxID=2794583 RepID=UPI0018F61B82